VSPNRAVGKRVDLGEGVAVIRGGARRETGGRVGSAWSQCCLASWRIRWVARRSAFEGSMVSRVEDASEYRDFEGMAWQVDPVMVGCA
jgi:hypothetical protein